MTGQNYDDYVLGYMNPSSPVNAKPEAEINYESCDLCAMEVPENEIHTGWVNGKVQWMCEDCYYEYF